MINLASEVLDGKEIGLTMATTRALVNRQGFDRQAADWLRNAIISQQYAPGEKLTEAEVAEKAGVSRSTARAALMHLSVEGLVTRQAYSAWSVTGLSAADAWEVYALRRALDGTAARLAAERIDDAGRALIRTSIDEFSRLGEGGDLVLLAQADVAIHSAIVDASGNRRLRQHYDLIMGINVLYISRSRLHFDVSIHTTNESHQQIYNAISAGDGDLAQRLAEDHVDYNGADLVKRLQEAERA